MRGARVGLGPPVPGPRPTGQRLIGGEGRRAQGRGATGTPASLFLFLFPFPFPFLLARERCTVRLCKLQGQVSREQVQKKESWDATPQCAANRLQASESR